MLFSTISVHGANVQLFYDDFLGQGFPSQWTGAGPSDANTVNQNGGYLTMTEYASQVPGSPGQVEITRLAANSTVLLGPNTPDGQRLFMVWKLTASNFSLPSDGIVSHYRVADVTFGLKGAASIPNVPRLTWDLIMTPDQLGTKSAVTFDVVTPMQSENSLCFDTAWNFNPDAPGALPTCGVGHGNSIAYMTNLDLTQSHIFTMTGRFYPISHTSWIAINVDANGWLNISQSGSTGQLGCRCIDQVTAGGSYFSMWPAMALSYFQGAGTPVQSIGAAFDYVTITNYVLTTLPTGQLLSSNINPPKTNQGIYQNGGFSLTQYVQFESWSMGQGNIYAGGTFLTGLFLLILSIGLGGVYYKIRIVSITGWIWNISTITLVFFMYYCGVIPLLYPVLTVLGAVAIAFGIIRSGPTGRYGGEVPD